MANPDTYDVVIVGFGIAGVTAALEAAQAGAKVLVLDRGYGGGASGLSGGVVYAGGGTAHQRAAGIEDTPEEMFRYLKQEIAAVVSDETLRRFCETSAASLAWLESKGAKFSGPLCPYKTSYPCDKWYLYYSGNEKAWPFSQYARPAPRGHRMVAKGLSSGHDLLAALMKSAEAEGIEFRPLSRVSRLLFDDKGRVTGVSYRGVELTGTVGRRHKQLTTWGGKFGNWFPRLGKQLTHRADVLWDSRSAESEVHGKSVIMAAGGFVFNPEMHAQYAFGAFKDIRPLGTVGDDGTGIHLGESAGGVRDHMDRMTAWRFLTPPSKLVEGVAVGMSGRRIANEDLYGATFTEIFIREHEARGWLILDSQQWAVARSQIIDQTEAFQRAQAYYLFSKGHVKAATLDELASKTEVGLAELRATLDAYNAGIKSGEGDPHHKAAEVCSLVEEAPYYAINIAIKNSPLYPCSGLTLGGLRVNEDTGELLDDKGNSIPGIYAAGRSAVGVCSNNYISGLSLADGVFSGRRAGRHAAMAAEAESSPGLATSS